MPDSEDEPMPTECTERLVTGDPDLIPQDVLDEIEQLVRLHLRIMGHQPD